MWKIFQKYYRVLYSNQLDIYNSFFYVQQDNTEDSQQEEETAVFLKETFFECVHHF